MLDWLTTSLTFLLALGSGLIAGVFFAFSSFVMGALGRLPAAQGIAAMQSINVVVINPIFLGVFMGTALLALLVAGYALSHLSMPGMGYVALGSVLYVIGSFAVTVFGNVPLNEALVPLQPDSADAALFWPRYLKDWVMWNHVRTVASLAASGAFIWAMRTL
ncbi:anthrone oxygenase family protein [Dongia rigui]|uniref:Anthrone oxygenase family protein n=1 Tax=Dongia rigui TaxID=940149 RepID=A0ABU5DWI5_9PROT|nr:anthrone oxygenase family protein [Dongia rigui]MDY0871671.1 anthrone oxygenase family protein [Dongia rigui]